MGGWAQGDSEEVAARVQAGDEDLGDQGMGRAWRREMGRFWLHIQVQN